MLIVIKVQKILDKFFDRLVIYGQKLGNKLTKFLFACVYLQLEKEESENSDSE